MQSLPPQCQRTAEATSTNADFAGIISSYTFPPTRDGGVSMQVMMVVLMQVMMVVWMQVMMVLLMQVMHISPTFCSKLPLPFAF